MALFRRRHDAPATVAPPPTRSRFEAAALERGWEPADASVFDSKTVDAMEDCTHVFHGHQRRVGDVSATYGANVHDGFRADRDGREVLVANAWTNITGGGSARAVAGISVCAAEIPALISLVCVQPRRFRHHVVALVPEVTTGDAAFDEGFRVQMAPGLPAVEITPEMRRLISARDDWIFLVERYRFTCFGDLPFDSVDEMARRIDAVLAIVAAFPESVVPNRVDHSQDDLIARIARLDTVEDALALLQDLSPDDRELLARSDTPLAGFADVGTPEEAIARFQSLDVTKRLQILAMFQRVDDSGR
jgi:hypothetical protein